uniref:Uncharacterized protein n=1 Tax=Micrurus spixii TaxID=129469 RepID=A0A2D4NDU2_9SAUR
MRYKNLVFGEGAADTCCPAPRKCLEASFPAGEISLKAKRKFHTEFSILGGHSSPAQIFLPAKPQYPPPKKTCFSLFWGGRTPQKTKALNPNRRPGQAKNGCINAG